MDLTRVEAIVERHANRPGATLPILHDIQHELGYIPDEAIGVVATGLNLSRAEIYGVVTFYADFRRTAPVSCTVKARMGRGVSSQSIAWGIALAHPPFAWVTRFTDGWTLSNLTR
ncbi:MAG: NAD(P)H-dependent oxidoreductase subunit E [Blastopirellula sp.]|nr:NAD(P)H-dependent oxidoreductase subunit E [Blastopirellula sp.]